ncbi:MAG: hypothetical protein ACYCOR_20675 [Acidobacteriaceae bacterium]
MTRSVHNARGNALLGRLADSSMLPIFLVILLVGSTLGMAFGAKKAEKTLTTPDGKPVRTVYVDAGSVVMANAATAQLNQDTCLTTVSDPKQADAVLEVGIALPSVGGDSGGGPDVFGSKPRTQTLGNARSAKPKRSASVTCSDSKGESGGCTTPYSAQGGELPIQPAADWTEGMGPSYTVSLASPENNSQDLWDPDGRRKHSSWSNQLREAAGCPVCPGERFNPRRDKMTYRQWMQAKCPDVLPAAAK